MKIGKYDYPNCLMETVKIDKEIKKEMSNFCKKKKINKSKLVENFYKTILLRFREGSLNSASGYMTIKIF